MQMDSRDLMKRPDKGKRAIIENEVGGSDDDDELDIDSIFESVHRRMLEEPDYVAPELSILGGRTSPPLVADHLWQSDSAVAGRKLDAAAPSFYMHPKPLPGALKQNHKETGLTGFGPMQTNISIINQDLSSAFSGMSVSGINGTTDLDNRFHLNDDKAELIQRYLNKYANSSIDGRSSSIKNASFPNQNHNIGSSNSQSSNYMLGGYDVNSSSPFIPSIQRDGGNFPNSFALGVELQNLYGAQIRHQLYLQSLRASKHIASQVGEQRDLTNLNVEFPEHSNAYNARVSSTQSPQREMSMPGTAPAHSQGYFVRSVYGPMPNRGRPLEGSIIPSHTHDISTVIRELQHPDNTFELQDVTGHFVELCKDQHGSRFIQVKLQTASPEEMDMFFHEIRPHALKLMADVFGNYVLQKFLDYGSTYHIRELANQMTGSVFQLSLDIFSCRVIQKALEVIEMEKRIALVSELEGHVLRLIRDQNGNHVIQKCIEQVPEDEIRFILSAIFEQIIPLCTHPYGCRVIQRVLENCHSEKTQRILTDEIAQHAPFLSDDLFGNYVVQRVLESRQPQVISNIIKNLTGQIVHLSTLKYASNVVEKCLKYGSLAERKSLVDEMLYLSHDYDAFQLLIKDQFGNYVIQRVLESCNDEQLEQILDRIKVHMNTLHMDPYARKIFLRLQTIVIAGERRHHIPITD